jgi:hypothetical protein
MRELRDYGVVDLAYTLLLMRIAQLTPVVEIYALYHASALHNPCTLRLAAPGLTVEVRTDGEGLWLGPLRVRVEWEPCIGGRYLRPKFRCPECGNGCRLLYARTPTDRPAFVCRVCAGVRYASHSATRLAPLLWAQRLRQISDQRKRQHLTRPGPRIELLERRAMRGILRKVRGVERRYGRDKTSNRRSDSDPSRG